MKSDLSTEWLSKAIGYDVKSFTSTKIGTGQIAEVYRIELKYGDRTRAGPSSVVLKTTSEHVDSRLLGIAGGLYEREYNFYDSVAPLLATGPIASIYRCERDAQTGEFALLMKDCYPAEPGNDIKGATLEEAKICLSELGRLHGLVLNHVPYEKASWLPKSTWTPQEMMIKFYDEFLKRYPGKISSEHEEIGRKFVQSLDAYQDAQQASSVPTGLVHADYRLDNILLDLKAEQPVTLVDWQTCIWGPILGDLAFFLGLSLTPEFRRQHINELVKVYYESVTVNAPSITMDDVNKGIRMQSFTGMRQAITAANVVERTDRGDELFLTMFQRSCELVTDTKALDVLPPPTILPHLEPEAKDEEIHPFTDNPLHNESWYFDVVDVEQQIGVWIRLGLTPNQKGSWYHALICGPNIPTVGLIDFEAPHPGPDLHVKTSKFEATHVPETPLKSYRITAQGQGESFDKPADIMHGKSGKPVQVKMDLLYETDGFPYRWRAATRYEIPCKVTGTFSWDDRTVTFTKCIGQRDHSWGHRDWWTADWVWSAFHLDDGTHTHQVHVRIPNLPSMGVGYVQKGDKLVECTDVFATETMDEDGLGVETTIKGAPLPLVLHIKPTGHAPLRLLSSDGKVTLFPRSWATVTTEDGRKGAGWLEWNIVDRSKA